MEKRIASRGEVQAESHDKDVAPSGAVVPADREGPSASPLSLITFRVGELRLGIDIRRVREVVRHSSLSLPLPGTSAVIGLVTLHGESTPVLDLSRVLGIQASSHDRNARLIALHHQGGVVCVLVDRVDGLLDLAPADLEPASALKSDQDLRWIDLVVRTATGSLIGVLATEHILSGISPSSVHVDPTHA